MQSLPIVVGQTGAVWTTAPSWMEERSPTMIAPSSPRSTACGHTVEPAPMVTSPMIVASGWT